MRRGNKSIIAGSLAGLLLLAMVLLACSRVLDSSVASYATPRKRLPGRSLDRFGGIPILVSDPTGFFRVEKFGDRWIFITPKGNAFWMLGVFNIAATTSIDNLGDSYRSRMLRKYDDGLGESWRATLRWGEQVVKRLRSWGFNTTAEYSSTYVRPIRSPEKMPYVSILRPSSRYGLTNKWGFAPGPFKDLIDCTDPNVYTGYRGSGTPDVFDPNFDAYVDGWLQATKEDPFWKKTLGSPWQIGIATDDADDLVGFGPGPEVPAPRLHDHIGWIALATHFEQRENSRLGVTYADPKVYSKYALRDFLFQKYAGDLITLNTAWGSQYTSWDSEGGYGEGTGLLDESGRSPWLGNDHKRLGTASPGVVVDLDAFLYEYAKKYFSTVAGRIREQVPNVLVFGPATLNGWGGLTRKEILRAAGEYVDVLQVGLSSQRVVELTAQYAGDIPIVTWEGFPANSDSSLWRYPNSGGLGHLQTQEARGRLYSDRLNFLFGATTASGVKPVVGIKFWAWCDSWGEKGNWGLVSFLDNAYDGKEAVVTAGTDPWGYPTGGEERDYGDFISSVRQANLKILQQLREEIERRRELRKVKEGVVLRN